MLFKPWRTLDELLCAPETEFQPSLDNFLAVNPYLRSIVENIDYFHKCLEAAKRKPPAFTPVDEAAAALQRRHGHDETDFNETEWEVPEITMVDIERARLLRVDQNERLFAEKTLDHTHQLGTFSDDMGCVPFLPIAAMALPTEMMNFQQWREQLTKLIVKDDNFSRRPTNITLPSPFASTLSPSETEMKDRPLLSALNTKQRAAHSIIESHLMAQLHDGAPDQLLMMILGAGGTGKTVVINAIRETFKHHDCISSLGLTVTSGIAATLFGGSTIHSWAGISMNSSANKPSQGVAAKRQAHMGINHLLVIDEISMLEKSLLCMMRRTHLTSVHGGMLYTDSSKQ